MSDEQPKKISIPRLSKKRRSLAELGGESLAAALHWRELTNMPPTEEQPEQPPATPAQKEPQP